MTIPARFALASFTSRVSPAPLFCTIASTEMDALLSREPSTWVELLREDPIRALAKSVYQLRQSWWSDITPGVTDECGLTIACISDTHNNLPELPSGDILKHAGELSPSLEETMSFIYYVLLIQFSKHIGSRKGQKYRFQNSRIAGNA